MVDYLPQNAQSTKAIQFMGEEFSQAMPNAKVMVEDVSITKALEYKQALLHRRAQNVRSGGLQSSRRKPSRNLDHRQQ